MTDIKKFMKDMIEPVDFALSKIHVGNLPKQHSGFFLGNNDNTQTVYVGEINLNTELVNYNNENKIIVPNSISKVVTIKQTIPKNSIPEYGTSIAPITINS